MALPLNLAIGFSIAVLLNQKITGVNVWRTMYFLPSVIAGVAVALLWVRIFNTRIGLMNPFLKSIGIANPPGWLQDPDWAVPSLVIMSLWSVGGSMIIYTPNIVTSFKAKAKKVYGPVKKIFYKLLSGC